MSGVLHVKNCKSDSLKTAIDWDFKILTIKHECSNNIEYGKIEVTLDIQGDIVKLNNTNFIVVDKFDIKYRVENVKMNFKGLFSWRYLNNMANSLLNANSESILEFAIPETEKLMRLRGKEFANVFFASYSADELFP